jgi:DNA-binding response OmpR family regulator
MLKQIAIVDDDSVMRMMLSEVLVQAGYIAHACADGREFDRLIETVALDLVVVDMNLSGEDGLDIVKRVARYETIPIIVVTGDRTGDSERAIGLELGADDYLKKPFGIDQFLARIRVCLRRPVLPSQPKPDRTFQFLGWSLNPRRLSLIDPDGKAVEVSTNELLVLQALVMAPQTVLSREQLLRARGHVAEALEARSVDVTINRLRRKLDRDPAAPSMLRSERGIGYLFVPFVQLLEANVAAPRLVSADEAGKPGDRLERRRR